MKSLSWAAIMVAFFSSSAWANSVHLECKVSKTGASQFRQSHSFLPNTARIMIDGNKAYLKISPKSGKGLIIKKGAIVEELGQKIIVTWDEADAHLLRNRNGKYQGSILIHDVELHVSKCG